MRVLWLGHSLIADRARLFLNKLGSRLDLTCAVPKKFKHASWGNVISDVNPEKFNELRFRMLKGMMPGSFSEFFKKYDIIHIDEDPCSVLAFSSMFFSKLAGKKTVVFSWENFAKRDSFIKRQIELFSLSKCNALVAGSNSAKDYYLKKGVAESKISVIPEVGVDTDFFAPRKEQNFEDDPSILYIGRLVEEKGIQFLIKAFEKIKNDFKKARLYIVGSGPFEHNLKKIADKDVTFLDSVPYLQVPKLLNSCDIFVNPCIPSQNWIEQFGYAMIEALSCEKPVIASRVGAIPEILPKGTYLTRPGDIDDLSEKLRMLCGDSSLRKRLGKSGRRHVLNNFGCGVISEKYASLYDKVLG